ncbi:carbohydrate ABC transporter permease [Salinarchaeum laminariae]|uniref:carbohydrate ABC transporter permease n=1 Tax=Salinarchaeum laminariae TaxID=869888 RepID=UPI0020C0ACA5|nr:sugar ABC transporter permease [Salinarchaeum laminariae]
MPSLGIGDRLPFYRRLSGGQRFAYRLLLPALAAMTIVHFIPILWGLTISTMGVDLTYASHWYDAPFVGLDHFRYVLGIENFDDVLVSDTVVGERYRNALKNSVIFSVGTLVVTYVLGLTAALVLNQKFKGRFVARTLLLLPWVAPVVVSLYVWRMMFTQQGIINQTLLTIGLIDEPMFFLIGDNSMWALIFAHSWTQFPLVMIFLYAGLQSIPKQLYEAAAIDGAGRWGKFRYVTMPQLKPVSAVIVLLMLLWTMINYTAPFVLLGGAPPKQANVAILYIENYAFGNSQFGRGAAMSVVLFLIAMVMAMVYYRYLFDDETTGAGA